MDDVSIEGETLETEDVTESVTTFGAENNSVGWSDASMSVGGSSGSSIASAETLLTFTTEASEALFKPLADAATLASVEGLPLERRREVR